MVRRATRTATTTATATRISSTITVNQPPGSVDPLSTSRYNCSSSQSVRRWVNEGLRVDRLVEFTLRGFVRGIAVDVYGRHGGDPSGR